MHLWKPSHLSSATTVMMFAITTEKERNEWRKRVGDDRELPLTLFLIEKRYFMIFKLIAKDHFLVIASTNSCVETREVLKLQRGHHYCQSCERISFVSFV